MKWLEEKAKILSVNAGSRDSGEPYCNAKIQMWGGTISAKVDLMKKDQFAGLVGQMVSCGGELEYEANQWGVKATFHLNEAKKA